MTEHQVRDELSRLQHRLARVATLRAKRPAQSSKVRDIHTTDGAEQQILDPLWSCCSRPSGDLDEGQQHCNRRLLVQRQLVGGDGGRNASHRQGALDACKIVRGSNENRHVLPREVVVHVGRSNLFGDVRVAGGMRWTRQHADGPLHRRLLVDEFGGAMVALRTVRRYGSVIADAARAALAPRTLGTLPVEAQRDHRRRLSPRLPKRVREVEESLHLGSAERVYRLVRVTDSHHRASRPGYATQKLDLKRVGVLELIDVDRGDPLV